MGTCPACKKKLALLDRKDKRCTGCGEFFTYSKKGMLGMAATLAIVAVALLKACSSTPAELAATQAAAAAEKAAITQAKEQKALADQVADTLYEIKVSAAVECQAAVKAKIDLPHTVDFDIMSVRFDYDSTAGLYEMYNKFDYKNRFNAPLRAAYLCKVDAKGFKKGADVKVVSVKLGRE
jgi:hypothetical protein